MITENNFKKVLTIALITFSISTLSYRAHALSGDLLESFGLGGIVTTDFDTDENDSDGRAKASVIVGTSLFVAGFSDNGSNDDFTIAKYNSTTGALDNTFGSNGIVTTPFSADSAYANTITSDGTSLFVAGYTDSSDPDFALAKYNASTGALNTSFGTDGIVTTPITSESDVAYAITYLGGSLFVAGYTSNGIDTDFALTKYDGTTGALDTTFGTDGIVTTDISSRNQQAFAITTDGTSLFVAGNSYNGTNYDFAIAKYDPTTGALDTTFDTDGIVTTDFNANHDYAYAISIDGTSLFASGRAHNGTNYDFAIAKYDASTGALDTTFDTDGKVTTAIGTNHDEIYSIHTDGSSIFAAGRNRESSIYRFAVAKYNATTGALDTTFDTDGIVTTDIGSSHDEAYAICSDDSSLYVSGHSQLGSNYYFTVAKYDIDTGTLNTDFDSDGIATTTIGSSFDQANDVIAIGDTLYAAGYSTAVNSDDFAISKYNSTTGMLDNTFDSDGMLTTDFSGNDDQANTIISDGNSLFAAGYSDSGTSYDFAVAKYNATTGALDAMFGSGGYISTDFTNEEDIGYAIVSDDSSIFVVGSSYNGTNYDFAIAKYDATTGDLNPSFDTDGLVTTDFATREDKALAAVLNDESLYVAGYSQTDSGGYDFAIAKYNANTGALDATFDSDGMLTTDFLGNDEAAYAMTSDGTSLYLAGYSHTVSGYDFAVAKYNAVSGELDIAFNSSGFVTTNFATGDHEATSIAMAGNSIIVSGHLYNSSTDYDVVIAKYDATTGALDSNFDGSSDGNGKLILTMQPDIGDDYSYGMALNEDLSTIYLAGFCTESAESGKSNFCLIAIDNADDADTDGFSETNGDCNDADATINPDADEMCSDDQDNDCDGDIDADDTECPASGDDDDTIGEDDDTTEDDDDDTIDTDGDGVEDDSDNCPDNSNADQADKDADGIGDACEESDTLIGSSSGCHLTSQASAPNTFLVIATALASVWFIRMRTRNSI